MKEQLKLVGESYDNAIDLGRRGIDLYQELPEYITNDPDYPMYEHSQVNGTYADSGRQQIIEYLLPMQGMKFIDLGCCLNLMFRGYDRWPSEYYGVDISKKTIQLLKEFVAQKKLSIGSLYCGSMHETPYNTSFFDIGTCIGSLEYFDKDFVEMAITEFHRILKPDGKIVLDIPNIGSGECRIAMMIEDYLGRMDKFTLTNQEFESILEPYFEIEKKEEIGGMMEYFMICRK